MKNLLFNPKNFLRLVVLICPLFAHQGFAYDTVWTGTSGDFFNPANWSVLVPTNNNSLNVSSNGTAIIDTNSPFNMSGTDIFLNYADIGDSSGGPTSTLQGNIIINSGTVHLAESAGDSYWSVGFNTNGFSTFVVNGGTVLYDNPSATAGALWKLYPKVSTPPGISGQNGLIFYCGSAAASDGTAFGRIEIHSNGVMRIAHTLDFGNAGATTNGSLDYPTVTESGVLVMDGNSEMDIGDGFGTGLDLASSSINLSGNAKLVIGNTLGVGNPNGSSQQGYLTIGARQSTFTSITVSGNAQIDCMSLQNRAPATILLTNNAQFNVFNVLGGSGPVIIPYQASYLAGVNATASNTFYGEISNVVFTVADHSRFYVDTIGEFGTGTTPVAYSNAVNGLVIGNGQFSDSINGGNHSYGSTGILIIKDYGTLDVRQSLTMGTADSEGSLPSNSRGTLQVVGSNATVTIGSNLCLCIGFVTNVPFVPANAIPAGAVGCMSYVVTGTSQSTVIVSNNSYIHHQGTLQLALQGYSPIGGESYTLLTNINGTNDGTFATNDFSSAPLSPGLVWQINTTSNAVTAKVVNTFQLVSAGTNLSAIWSNQTGFNTNLLFTNILQSSTNAMTGYTDVVPAASSPYVISATNSAQFFRLRN